MACAWWMETVRTIPLGEISRVLLYNIITPISYLRSDPLTWPARWLQQFNLSCDA